MINEIWYLEDIDNIRNNPTQDYVLMRDLDFNNNDSYSNIANKVSYTTGTGWLPITLSTPYFSGTFDGNNKKIKNLYINRGSTTYIGLFGRTSSTAIIKNLLLIKPITKGAGSAGTLIGQIDCTIDNCHAKEGSVTSTFNYCGGFAGSTSTNAVIRNCSTTSNVFSSGRYASGFIGLANIGNSISKCFSRNTITQTTTSNDTSGFCGSIGFPIDNCYSITIINGNDNLAGFYIVYVTGANITNCYSVCVINGGTQKHPFTYSYFSDISGSFFNNEVSGTYTDYENLIGKSTGQMKSIATYTDKIWDIVNINNHVNETWYIDENNDYPRLGWETKNIEIKRLMPIFLGGGRK